MFSKENGIYALLIGAALLFGALGFWIGQRTGKMPTQVVEESGTAQHATVNAKLISPSQRPTATPVPLDAVFETPESPEAEASPTEWAALPYGGVYGNSSEPIHEAAALDGEGLDDTYGGYTLKRMENGLSVFYQGVALTHLDIPESLNQRTLTELEAGIPFSSMEDIESWLESFDS